MSRKTGRSDVGRVLQWHGKRGELGQALPLMVGAMMLLCGLLWQAARLGTSGVEAARLQAAADATALAGAVAGHSGAGQTAAANGVSLVEYQEWSTSVQVTVARSGDRATATALYDLEPYGEEFCSDVDLHCR